MLTQFKLVKEVKKKKKNLFQEVEGVKNGTYDYSLLKGDTGW